MNTLMAGAPRKHLITVDEYYRMAEVGLLAPDARVELIEGEIIDMVPIGSRHARAVAHLDRLFTIAVGKHALVRSQGPVRLNRRSEPEPDLALLKPRDDEYGRSHPGPSDVLLIIEVSDTTLDYDRNVKLPLYARHGIPEVWIVDLQHDQLLICRSPRDGRYIDCSSLPEPGRTGIAALTGIEVDLSRLLQR
ncbi:MAG TPA: Uma2 family endonuclease [Steroidobacteraceae bacterium]|nr:Uma2 family endonuclease [Steroidobacteraceae bacterium]